ncbi:hypothetical protein BH09PLA1_BH09PLA1_25260 [soil metagenome]
MRNVFDQYQQLENRLTHALACSLDQDRSLLRLFLKRAGVNDIPKHARLEIVEQQLPGDDESGLEGATGLPDVCIFDEDNGWAVLLESKLEAGLSNRQLIRHANTAKRRGYNRVHVIVISVDRHEARKFDCLTAVEWRDVYCWFRDAALSSAWARHFTEYVETLETQMIEQENDLRGTLTKFDGFHFDADHPYTYREGRRLIKLMGDELQGRKDLCDLGVDPKGARRGAITGRSGDSVWDFLPLSIAKHASQFTDFPHLTMAIARTHLTAAVTVPNGVKGGFRKKLRERELVGFTSLIGEVHANLRRVLKHSPGSKAIAYVLQRHFPSQSSSGIVDARLNANLETMIERSKSSVKHQPQWIETIYHVLVAKRSNIQFGIEARFPHECKTMRSERALDQFSKAWIALQPLIRYVTEG